MPPFPLASTGLQTRMELSKKLGVSARQVQVWFQNKRQRERKISRSKGMLSTPGLPDTPAVVAAQAKIASLRSDGTPLSSPSAAEAAGPATAVGSAGGLAP